MASFHILYDEEDTELGGYFEACKSDLVRFLGDNLAGSPISELNASFDVATLDAYLRGINPHNYLLIAYSHGDDSSLSRNGVRYISTQTNASLLINSLFYAVSCLSANDLGPEIIGHGGHIFVGYRRTFMIPLDYQEVSINCANSGLHMFILGQKAGVAFESMKAFYTTQIDRLMQFGAIIAASLLVDARESLVFLGDADLAITDFP